MLIVLENAEHALRDGHANTVGFYCKFRCRNLWQLSPLTMASTHVLVGGAGMQAGLHLPAVPLAQSARTFICALAGTRPACLHPLQALLDLVDELHACASVNIIITSRVKPGSEHLLELPPLDFDSAVSLLRRHSGEQSGALLAEDASTLVQLCGCNALLLGVLGAVIASRRCELEV